MNKSNLKISIKTPCKEKYNQFSSTNLGGYCSSCKKEVIDFRKMTQEDLFVFFEKNKGNTCGYFNESQLKTYPIGKSVKKNSLLNYVNTGFMSFSLISLLSIGHSFSQQKIKEKTHIWQTNIQNSKDSISNDDDYYRGKIISKSGDPLIGVNISVKGTNIVTITDFDGYYSLPKNKVSKDAVLVAAYLGYEAVKFEVYDKENKMKRIFMEEGIGCVLGEVSTEQIYVSKPSLLQRVKSLFKND